MVLLTQSSGPNLLHHSPLPSGEREEIDNLPVSESKVTIGVASSPDEKGLGAMTRMNEKAMKWVNSTKNSSLDPRDIHDSITYKFWPSISYGLCANSAKYEQLVEGTHKPYYILCPLGALARSAKRELRYLDSGFFGLGLPHWGVEAPVASTKKILSHFGAQSLLGVQYQLSLELLTIDLGLGPQFFLQDYSKYGDWVTDCILSELWARLH